MLDLETSAFFRAGFGNEREFGLVATVYDCVLLGRYMVQVEVGTRGTLIMWFYEVNAV